MASPSWMQVPSPCAVLSQRQPRCGLAASGRFSRASGCSLSQSLHSTASPHMSGGTERACLARATTLRRELVCPTCARLGRNAASRTASLGRAAPPQPLRIACRGHSARAKFIAVTILATNPGRNVPSRTSTWINLLRTRFPSAPILYASFQNWPSNEECRQQMYQQSPHATVLPVSQRRPRAKKSRWPHHRAPMDPA